ncbi:uncharacterized protein AMSG_11829 [Thecamonas trahens ATCC 50062]|uniref:Doublecortin domain-containing protein n=1 Tax=Thecamonas trahens ATCC 50062 TaxID=461836 RepID=A0A0L0D7U7_THETB|nr:hypothetical protein AMSG_11829 [Thecamonas trahens ATCC 50062]KNC48424.1 hypothetical protein AMSG_11829 [Thecamonas trahens ATCC 50062]|eukprot:XP_013758664.1 hypothetical protein AMSG_11829 [Thecamonas trahens ATCC 50062]
MFIRSNCGRDRLTARPVRRLRAHPDGKYKGDGARIIGASVLQLLNSATWKLALPHSATALYTLDGRRLIDKQAGDESGARVRRRRDLHRDLRPRPPPGPVVALHDLPNDTHVLVATLSRKSVGPVHRRQAPAHAGEAGTGGNKCAAPSARLEPRKAITLQAVPNGAPPQIKPARICGQEVEALLDDATRKLKLPRRAARFFTADGKPLVPAALADLDHGASVVVSCGEPFHTFGTVVASSSVKPISPSSPLLVPPVPHYTVRANTTGMHGRRERVARITATHPVKFLDLATQSLELMTAARTVYLPSGEKLFDQETSVEDFEAALERVADTDELVVATGEPFVPKNAPQKSGNPALRRITPLSPDSTLVRSSAPHFDAMRNGYPGRSVRVAGLNLDSMLEMATRRLALPSAARRAFLVNGTEIVGDAAAATPSDPAEAASPQSSKARKTVSYAEAERGSQVLISMGEPWHAPDDDSTILLTAAPPLTLDSSLVSGGRPKTVVVLATVNYGPAKAKAVRLAARTVRELLTLATERLGLPRAAVRAYEVGSGFELVDKESPIPPKPVDGKDLDKWQTTVVSVQAKREREVPLDHLPHLTRVTISLGEPYCEPGKPRRRSSRMVQRELAITLATRPKTRVRVFSTLSAIRNGARGALVVAGSLDELLDDGTEALGLARPAVRVYDVNGSRVTDFAAIGWHRLGRR